MNIAEKWDAPRWVDSFSTTLDLADSVPCVLCRGTGFMAAEHKCALCRGTGELKARR